MTDSPFLELLEREVVVGDGAMGTMLHARGIPWKANFDHLNLTQPELVRSIHRDYIAAGARLIETNTFGANGAKLEAAGLGDQVRAINLAGAQLAREVGQEGVFVAGAVGPLPRPQRADEGPWSDDEKRSLYREQMKALLEGGVDVLILETFPRGEDLHLALQVARDFGEVPVICQIAFPDRLPEEEEHRVIQFLLQLHTEGAAVIGGNCGSGPLYFLRAVEHIAAHSNVPLSAFPNTGFPQYMEGRYVYLSDPEYFADHAVRYAEVGVNLIGGCCGTTPEHIRLVAERLRGRTPARRHVEPIPPLPPAVEIVAPPPAVPGLLDRLEQEKILIVELDPPRGSMNYKKVIGNARILEDEGVQAISIAENPLASLRMSSFVLSFLVQRETGLTAVCHCTCRDRNLLGQQSELMGAHVLGLRTILALTGDPTTLAGDIGASSVFDTNSFGLVEMLHQLNQGINAAGRALDQPTNFTIGVAFNPNRARIEAEIKRLRRKVALGAQFAMSQMVYDPLRVEEMYARTRDLNLPLFVGLMPLVSARNAEFLHHEIPGFKIPAEVRQRMKEAGEDRNRAVETGLQIMKELIDVALQSGAPGIYLVTPFDRVELIVELVRYIKRSQGTPAQHP